MGAELPREVLHRLGTRLLGYEQGDGKEPPRRDKGTLRTNLLRGQAIHFTSPAPV